MMMMISRIEASLSEKKKKKVPRHSTLFKQRRAKEGENSISHHHPFLLGNARVRPLLFSLFRLKRLFICQQAFLSLVLSLSYSLLVQFVLAFPPSLSLSLSCLIFFEDMQR